jgi:glycosyltransferase involved in cell wall biosynthesis
MKLALFFTHNVSLSDWSAAGILEREAGYYLRLGGLGVRTVFVTHGGAEDLELAERVAPIEVLPIFAGSRRPRGRFAKYAAARRLVPVLSESLADIDVVKTNQLWGGWLAADVAERLGKPFVARCGFEHYANHVRSGGSVLARPFVKGACGGIYRRADAVFVPTAAIREEIEREFGVPREKFGIVPNAVDTELFKPPEGDAKRGGVLSVGRLEPVKNIDLLIEAMAGTGERLDVVGDGSERSRLEELSKRLDVDARFHGIIPNPELPKLLRGAAVFAQFSSHEGAPKTILEAMSCGTAVLASDVPGTRDVVEDGKTGVLTALSAETAGKELKRLLSDAVERRRLGDAARRRILDRFSLDSVSELELEALNRIAREIGVSSE